MQYLNELIQNKALFFSVISVLVATIVFIGYLIFRERQKDQEEIDEIMSSLVEPKRKTIMEEVEEDKGEKMEAVQEVEVKREEPVMEVKQDSSLDIEAMLEQMQKDLSAKAEDVVATFEQEQEENSIISYQELVRSLKGEKVSSAKLDVEPVVKVEESVKEIPHTEQLSMDTMMEETKTEPKRFKNTDFISPVYGKMEEHLEYPTVPQFNKNDREIEKELETYESNAESSLVSKNIDDFLGDFDFDNNIEVNSLEQTLNMKPLSEEVKKNDEFLQALKDFRKNLD